MKFQILTSAFLLHSHFTAYSQTPTPPTLPEFDHVVTQHTRQRADAITKIDSATAKALDALKAQYMQRSNLDGALKVQAKIDELLREVQELATYASPPLGARGAVYADKHEGQVGMPQFVKDNVYSFEVSEVTSRATVMISEDPPKESSEGEFVLKVGDNSNVIGTWNQKSAASGHLQFNASKWITKPGKYSIEVKWKGGAHGLHITSITIDTRSQ